MVTKNEKEKAPTFHKGGYFTKKAVQDLEYLIKLWDMNQSQVLERLVTEAAIRERTIAEIRESAA